MTTIIFNYRSGKEIIPKGISDSVLNVIQGMDYSLGKYYLRNHPGMDVDIQTVEGINETMAREIHLRKEAEP